MIDLDVACWRCCFADAVLDRWGGRLCGACAAALDCQTAEVFGAPPYEVVAHNIALSQWAISPRTHCWRCITIEVDPGDDLGLCRACVRGLRKEEDAWAS